MKELPPLAPLTQGEKQTQEDATMQQCSVSPPV